MLLPHPIPTTGRAMLTSAGLIEAVRSTPGGEDSGSPRKKRAGRAR
jgi:hypothetical protein